jgi:hypothetical protein
MLRCFLPHKTRGEWREMLLMGHFAVQDNDTHNSSIFCNNKLMASEIEPKDVKICLACNSFFVSFFFSFQRCMAPSLPIFRISGSFPVPFMNNACNLFNTAFTAPETRPFVVVGLQSDVVICTQSMEHSKKRQGGPIRVRI